MASGTIGGQNLEKAWKVFLGMIVVLIILPVALPIFCIFYSIGEGVKKYYKDKHGPTVAKARGMDGAFVHEVAESRPFINAYYVLKGTLDIEKVRTKFNSNILQAKDEDGQYRYHKFEQSIGRRYAYFLWRDTNDFNINDHIREINIDNLPLESKNTSCIEEHSPETSQEQDRRLICRYLSIHGNEPMPKNKPQWEIVAFQRPHQKYIIIFRIHHAIGDGVSLVRMFLESLVEPPLMPPSVGPKQPNIILRVVWNILALCLVPFGIFHLYMHKDANALHGGKLTGKKIYRISKGISLAKVKAVKSKAKATVNDVMMACLSAALTKFYEKKQNSSPFTTTLIPVSLHNLQEPNVLHNKFSWAICLLPTVHESSSLERLRKVKSTMDAMKHDPLITAFYYVVRIVNGIFPAKIAEYLFYAPGITMVCSNVPGPQDKIQVIGDELEEFSFIVPDRSPTGCGVAMLSYNGVIRPTLMVDKAFIQEEEEADEIMADLEEEISKMEEELKNV